MASIEQVSKDLHELLKHPEDENCMSNIIEKVIPLTEDEKMEILKYYKDNCSSNGLVEDIEDVFLNTRFAGPLARLFTPRVDLCCYEIHKRLKYYISNEDVVLEILIQSPKWLLDCIKERYPLIYQGTKIEEEIAKVYSGAIKKNILTLLNTERNENKNPDRNECQRCANILKSVAPTAWGIREDIFNEIFAKKSPEELLLIGRMYYQMTQRTLSEEVEEKLKGRLQVLLKELLYGVINPSELMAIKLRNEIKGIGVNPQNLNRILISRYDVDMPLVRIFYYQMFGDKLKDDIENLTYGGYRDILSAMIQKTSLGNAEEMLRAYSN